MLDCNRDHVLLFSLISCVIFLISFIVYPVFSSQFDFEYSYNQGWNAYHQIGALDGALYQNESRYVFTNYTPLYFFIVGYLSKSGDVILVGRALSTISFVGIVFLVAFICKKLHASRREALFGAVMCIGLLGAYHRIYVGIDDPQLLGSAVAAGFARLPGTPRGIYKKYYNIEYFNCRGAHKTDTSHHSYHDSA